MHITSSDSLSRIRTRHLKRSFAYDAFSRISSDVLRSMHSEIADARQSMLNHTYPSKRLDVACIGAAQQQTLCLDNKPGGGGHDTFDPFLTLDK